MFERKRDLSNLNDEQVLALQGKLAAKLSEILEKAGKEANQLLNQYGMEVKIGYSLKEQKTKKSRKS